MAGLNAVVSIVTSILSENGRTLFNKLPRALRISMGLLSATETDSQEQQEEQQHQQQQREQRPIAIPRRYSALRSVSNPYSDFKQMVEIGNGTIRISWDERRNESGNAVLEWGCKFTYQMTETSVCRSHIRYAQNKKKAKTLVVRDILDYYEKRPDQLDHDKDQQLQGEAAALHGDIPLTIDPNEYFHETSTAPPPPLSSSLSLSTTPSPITPGGVLQTTGLYNLSSPNNNINASSDIIHIPDNKRGRSMEEDEEYSQHMMNVLLGVKQVSLGTEQRQKQLQQKQDILPKRHKSVVMDYTTTTTTTTTTKSTMSSTKSIDNDNMMITSAPSSTQQYRHPAAALLPDTIHPPSTEPISSLSAIRKIVDISKLDKMLNDPVQAANPKSSLFSYIHDIPELDIRSEFQEDGPPHQKIFQATSTIYSSSGYTVSATGMGLKKADAEQMAILNVMKKVVGPSF